MQWWLIISGSIILLLPVVILACYFTIKWLSAPYLYDDADAVPYHQAALVLGTARLTPKGGDNLLFQYRMDAAEALFQQHKASYCIVSGAEKDRVSCSEGDAMRTTLVSRGLPPAMIIPDNYGCRTWDSLWRCRHVYGYAEAIVISQRFHTERAVFTGRKQGMAIIGYNAAGKAGSRMFIRECLARVKCILDLYLIHPVPFYLKESRRHSAK